MSSNADEGSPKRILFVDDEPRVLEGLERMLFPYMDDWEMIFVDSGREALDELADERFDVIVTDMRMPGMDGATLLREVHARHPNVIRMVLSGHTELEAALRAMPVAHQYLSKPCPADRLVEALERACRLDSLLADGVVREMVGELVDLPARPRVFSELARALADERAGMDEIARIIEEDIAISARVLQLVNSAFFAPPQPVRAVKAAVVRLGTRMIRDLVLALEVFQEDRTPALPGFSLDAQHRHAMSVAYVARRLLEDSRDADDAFLAGLLHDIGKLVLVGQIPEYLRDVLAEAKATGRPLDAVERGAKGVTHARIGAYLLGLWGMPYPVMEAVANHHAPERCDSGRLDVSAAVLLANAAAHEVEGVATGEGRSVAELVAQLGVAVEPEAVLAVAAGAEGGR